MCSGLLPRALPWTSAPQLARLLIPGEHATRRVAELSGGERFRVALAAALLAQPAPQLLLLDEPTNNLDLDTVSELVQTLDRYQGALVTVSHDAHFLDELGTGALWTMSSPGTLPDRS